MKKQSPASLQEAFLPAEPQVLIDAGLSALPLTTPTAVFSENKIIGPKSTGLALNLSERRLLLQAVDIIAICLALWLSLYIRKEVPTLDRALAQGHTLQAATTYVTWSTALILCWLPFALLAECYSLPVASRLGQSLSRTGIATVLTTIAYLLMPWITPSLPQSRLEMLALPCFMVTLLWLWRLSYVTIFGRTRCEHRAIVVGAGLAGQIISSEVRQLDDQAFGSERGTRAVASRGIGYRIVGFVDDDPDKQQRLFNGIPVLGTRHDLKRIAEKYQVDELVLAISQPETMRTELVEAILECRESGISLTTMPSLYEALTGRVPVEHAGRHFHIVLPIGRSATHRFYLLCQRLFDIFFGLLGCLLLGLVVPFVALANRLWSPGPLFYSQQRVGQGGNTFSIVKFRSMVVDAEKFSGATWAQENDPRITKIGKWLRLTRLDEIPQFMNVLKGEMAIVGPRPERPNFVEQLAREIPFYRARHAVKPGLTGWAQVKYRYGASVEDSLIKLQYDLYYIKYQSVLLDIVILFKTVMVVLGFKGR